MNTKNSICSPFCGEKKNKRSEKSGRNLNVFESCVKNKQLFNGIVKKTGRKEGNAALLGNERRGRIKNCCLTVRKGNKVKK